LSFNETQTVVVPQKTVTAENVCDQYQNTSDVNGNQSSDAFLDLDPDNKWKSSTVSVSAGLGPCEPFGVDNDSDGINNNLKNINNNDDDDNINYDDNDDDDDDDDDGSEPERPYVALTSSSSPPPQPPRCRHPCQQQQPRQPWISSTSSLDRVNRDRSTDSLDRVEFCSTADYR